MIIFILFIVCLFPEEGVYPKTLQMLCIASLNLKSESFLAFWSQYFRKFCLELFEFSWLDGCWLRTEGLAELTDQLMAKSDGYTVATNYTVKIFTQTDLDKKLFQKW